MILNMQKMNKKAFAFTIPIAVGILILIAGIIFTIWGYNFISSTKGIFTIIGSAIMAITLIYIVPKLVEGNVTNKKIGIVLAIFGIGFFMVLFANSGLMQQTYMNSDNYFEKPTFATIKCTSTTGVSEQGTITKTDSFVYKGNTYPGMWLSDVLPRNTDIWQLKVSASDWSLFTTSVDFMYIVCPTRQVTDSCIDGGISNLASPSAFTTFSVDSSKFIFASLKTHILGSQRTGSYTVTYNAYNLELSDVFRGGLQKVPNTVGCVIPTSDIGWQKRIISSTDNTIKTSTSSNSLQPGEYFNYVSGTVTSRKDGNIQNNGYCIYANGEATIYKISTITTPTDSYNIVDTSIPIGTPQCCNGLAYPNGKICLNGVFVDIQNKQCTTSSDCGSLEWNRDLSTPQQVIKFSCVNNKCVNQTKSVDCTVISDCLSGYTCDRNTWTCLKAGTPGEILDINKCTKWYQETGVTTNYKYSFLGFKFGATTEPVCKTASWLIISVIGTLFVIFMLFVVLLLKPKSVKRRIK